MRTSPAAWRPAVVDASIAITAYLVVQVSSNLRPVTVLLAVLTSMPLLVRRRFPVSVSAVVGLATTLLALDRNMPPLPLGSAVAMYSTALSSGPLGRLAVCAGTSIGVGLSAACTDSEPIMILCAALSFVIAYLFGTTTRARHREIALLAERARLLDEQRRAAGALERARIARDMHDILAHAISVMVVQAEAGPIAAGNDLAGSRSAFERIADAGREALAQLR